LERPFSYLAHLQTCSKVSREFRAGTAENGVQETKEPRQYVMACRAYA